MNHTDAITNNPPDPVLRDVEEVTGSLVQNLKLEGLWNKQSIVAEESPVLKAIAKKEAELKNPPPSVMDLSPSNTNYRHHLPSGFDCDRGNGECGHHGNINRNGQDHDTITNICTRDHDTASSGEGSSSNSNTNSNSNGRNQVTNSNQSDDRSNSKLSSNSTYNDASVSSVAASASMMSTSMDASTSATRNGNSTRPLNSIFTSTTAAMQDQGPDSDVPLFTFHRGATSHVLKNKQEYRLPYPMDDPLLPSGGIPSKSHAAVVAKLPPPPLEEKQGNILLKKQRKRKLSSSTSKHPGAFKMTDGKARKMSHSSQDQSSSNVLYGSSTHRYHNDSKIESIQLDESKESTSDNGSDSGYAASASSNDASGGTSQSGSSSDSSQQQQNSPTKHKVKSDWTDDGKRNSSSCSSDLADFSSAGSSNSFCSREFPFLGPLSESDGSGCEESGKLKGEKKRNVSHSYSGRLGSSSRQSKIREGSGSILSSKSTATRFASAAADFVANSHSVAATAAVDSSPDLQWSHRRRRAAARARGLNGQPCAGAHGSKTTDLDESETMSNNSRRHSSKSLGPAYKLPDTWSFVERQLKEKMNLEDILRKKSYEEHHDELTANYKSAVKRIDHNINSSASISSVKSSLTSNSGNGNPRISKHPLYDVGVDIMAKILTYLEPNDTYSILSQPLSKEFRMAYTAPQDLWKVLCLSEPYYAKPDHDRFESDDSKNSYPICEELKINHLLGRYRLLYSSLIKCTRYLNRVKEDAKNGRTPSASYESDESTSSFQENSSLLDFFASAQRDKAKQKRSLSGDKSSDKGSDSSSSSDSDSNQDTKKKKSNVKYGFSKLTNNLFGPAHGQGVAGNVELPWSCAIYSVVNWMVAFADVVGIQLMCLKVLPDLLVNEHQRTSAQHVGLTDIVLRAMVLFPDVVELHTAAFHTLVLLARPLGGKEGMLFNSSMVNASGIFNVGSSTGKSGIAIMLDSMKRFVYDDDLMAMSCWSMVNIALIPSQKIVLVRLGGISAAVNALIHHPHNAEVQFRALFALINLVIPSENLADNSVEAVAIQEQVGGINQDTETEMLDESAGQVINLVVTAMKNFCSSEPILNRACLVLHNLSLNESYHKVLLLTPNCYQMLEWCIGNYRHDEVLQRSARGTLTRLQVTLSQDPVLRSQFTSTLRMQQQLAGNNGSRIDGSVQSEEQLDVSMRSTNSM